LVILTVIFAKRFANAFPPPLPSTRQTLTPLQIPSHQPPNAMVTRKRVATALRDSEASLSETQLTSEEIPQPETLPNWLVKLRRVSELKCLLAFWAFNSVLFAALIATSGSPGPPLRLLREVLAGGLAAAIAEVVFFPAEHVKVLVQTARNDNLSSGKKKAIGPIGVVRGILADQGPSGLWTKGIVAGCMRAVFYQGLRLGLFPPIKRLFLESGVGGQLGIPDFFMKLAAGMLTGALGAYLASPLDLAKVMLAAQSRKEAASRLAQGGAGVDGGVGGGAAGVPAAALPPGSGPFFANSLDALATVGRRDGVAALWRVAGGVAMLRATCASGAQLATYDCVRGAAAGWGPVGLTLASACGAVAYATAAAPVDLVKNRVMAAAANADPKDRPGPVAVVASVVRTEGLGALWRGWGPAVIHLLPVVCVVFPLMEQLRKLLGVGVY